jgi:hypothetical protein
MIGKYDFIEVPDDVIQDAKMEYQIEKLVEILK